MRCLRPTSAMMATITTAIARAMHLSEPASSDAYLWQAPARVAQLLCHEWLQCTRKVSRPSVRSTYPHFKRRMEIKKEKSLAESGRARTAMPTRLSLAVHDKTPHAAVTNHCPPGSSTSAPLGPLQSTQPDASRPCPPCPSRAGSDCQSYRTPVRHG